MERSGCGSRISVEEQTVKLTGARSIGLPVTGMVALMVLGGGLVAFAERAAAHFRAGNLVLSRSVYNNDPANIVIGTILPPNCASTAAGCSKKGKATNDGSLPLVWNNNLADGSFGIT